MKGNRQKKIIEIISKNTVETQEELTSLLIKEGFKVTQATVSRDIKQLRIIKTTDGNGNYRYAVGKNETPVEKAKYNDLISRTVTSANCAGNIVVVKTHAGMAQAAGAAIDGIGFDGVLGCIAGDDTIMIVAQKENEAANISDKLSEMII